MSDPKIENSPAPGTDPEKLTPEEMEIINKARAEMEQAGKEIISTFDKEVQEAGGGADIFKSLADVTIAGQKMLENVLQQVSPYIKDLSESARKAIAEFSNYIAAADNYVTDFCGSDKMKELVEIFPDAAEWIEATKEERPGGVLYLSTTLHIIADHIPAIRDFVREQDFRGSMADFMQDRKDPDTGEMLESLFDKCILSIPEEAAADEIFSIGAHRVKELDYPIDKVNNSVWNLLEANTHGQLTFTKENPLRIKSEPNGQKNPVNILYSINFDDIESELPIVKRLTEYDKRVYISIGGLYAAGNSCMSLAMIYQAMGYRGEPGKADREKIDKSLTKMSARITLDTREEKAAKYNYPCYEYEGDLLPFERIRKKTSIDGQLVDSVIHVFREPPLIEFARGRKQLTTIHPKVLQTPLSKTEQNIAIEDYCIERIAQYKREGRKILLSTLYKKCNITSPSQKTRTPQKLKKLFDYYVECGEIKSYTLTKDAIIFDVD